MMKVIPVVVLLPLLAAWCTQGLAQGRPGGGGFGNFGGGGGGGFGNFGSGGRSGGASAAGELTLDTSDIHYFYATDPATVFPFRDSLLDDLHQYDPIRRQGDFDYASLGNLGSAARPLFFRPTWRRGFDAGYHAFDCYRLQTDALRYYRITQAYTQAGYTQGPTQSDAQFNVRFSRNYSDGLNLAIEHRRINNTGAYDFQKATVGSFGAGLWYHSRQETYDGFLSVVSNSTEQQNNGGAGESLGGSILPAFQVAVNLESAESRYADRELAYTQYFHLDRLFSETMRRQRQGRREAKAAARQPSPAAPPVDSTGRPVKTVAPPAVTVQPARQPTDPAPPPARSQPVTGPGGVIRPDGRTFTLYHRLAWRTESFKSYDPSPDSAYYGDFLVDSRGLRNAVARRSLENTVKLISFRPAAAAEGDTLRSSGTRDWFEAGVLHTASFLTMEPVDTQAVHHLFLTGRIRLSPGRRLRLDAYGHLGVGADAGDFRVNGSLSLSLGNIGELELEAVNQLYTPTLTEQRFYVSGQELWRNNFTKVLENSISIKYSLPAAHFSATGAYHLLDHYVYFDTAGRPRQSGTFSILQLALRKDIRLGSFHLDQLAAIQQASDKAVPLPLLYSKHSLYLESKLFKRVMLAKLGVDARLTADFRPPGYHPLTGQFFVQPARLPFTPLLDAFLSFRVKTFRFFAKVENLLTSPLQTYYFQTAGHPLPFGLENGGLRLGVDWRLVD
ncbi:MAG: hypothetical protein RLY31_2169 [Bacteroidota bacterium]|jgi:hypothetical protein